MVVTVDMPLSAHAPDRLLPPSMSLTGFSSDDCSFIDEDIDDDGFGSSVIGAIVKSSDFGQTRQDHYGGQRRARGELAADVRLQLKSARQSTTLETPQKCASPHSPAGTALTPHEQHVNREQRRVLVGAVVSFIIYLIVVSWLMMIMDQYTSPAGMDFVDSFYFLFTSVALIGFGDVFPRSPNVVLINCAFIVFGIALFGMCYFILQEEIRATASAATHRARRSISRYRQAINLRLATPSPFRLGTRAPLTPLAPRPSTQRRTSAPTLLPESAEQRVTTQKQHGSSPTTPQRRPVTITFSQDTHRGSP